MRFGRELEKPSTRDTLATGSRRSSSMKVLGLMMVRNGGLLMKQALDSMAVFCDDICVLNDRSLDDTETILKAHPTVTNVFSVSAQLSRERWFFPESMHFSLLYRMADYYAPDWVVLVDHDEVVESPSTVREFLASLEDNVSGVRVSRISAWSDPEYPLMVPLMSAATSLQGNIWRFYPGLTPGAKRLHNRRFPNEIDNLGRIVSTDKIVFRHYGWDTLQKRVEKVDEYIKLDPTSRLNFGIGYDVGLLFGYERSKVNVLISDYKSKLDEYRKSQSLNE
jgi:glycosyltransferase involved in cell wall biosynthesis